MYSRKIIRFEPASLILSLAPLVYFLLIFALLFSRAMNQGLGHDEEQHVASGQLLAGRGLLPYVDYPFLHMPYIAGVNALAATISDYDFLAARSFVAFFGLLSVWVLYSTARSLFGISFFGYLAGITAVMLFVFEPLFINTHTRATNHALPSLLSLLAFLCFRKGASQAGPARWFILCGGLVGLAAGLRLSYAVMLPAFGVAVLFVPSAQTVKERLRGSTLLGMGFLLALLPALALFLSAPKEFFYGNYVYFRLNTLYYQQLDHPIAMNFGAKMVFFMRSLIQNPPSWVIFLAAMIYGTLSGVRYFKTKEPYHFEPAVLSGLVIVLLASAFVPTPSQPQYLFTPFPFLLILFIYMIREIETKFQKFALPVVGVFLLLTLASANFRNLKNDLSSLFNPEEWQTVQFHRFAENLRSRVPDGKVLTLAPIVPLEAGLDVYEIFAVGPFSWRTAHLVGDERRKEYGILSFTDLEEFLGEDPPEAILVGFEGRQNGFRKQDSGGLEKPFIEYALDAGFTQRTLPASFVDVPITLWVPASSSQTR